MYKSIYHQFTKQNNFWETPKFVLLFYFIIQVFDIPQKQ